MFALLGIHLALPGIGWWFYTAVNCEQFFGIQLYTSYTYTNVKHYGNPAVYQLYLYSTNVKQYTGSIGESRQL